ncbi:MAG: GntR family transcriptional regulator [Rhizobiaceae bacterium]|nr:GntR family transcriptional regulator [Rhizobiaceae bacterium]
MSETFRLRAVEHDNLGEIVYGQLSEALMKGRFAPDARLTIRDLAGSLGTSVTPVRDAILRLIQDEALVQRTPRDVRVPIMTLERYWEIRQIRMKLEGLAARESALKASPEDIARLRDLIDRNERAIDRKDWLEGLDLNQTFHFALADIASMVVLRGILNRLWLQMGPLIAAYYSHGERVMIDQHYNILKAIEDRDPDAAELAIISDISNAGDLIKSRLEEARNSKLTSTT